MNKYKMSLIILLLSFVSILSFAQNDSIQIDGVVVTSFQNEPIPGAIVSVSGSSQSYTTDKEGKFSIKVAKTPNIELNAWFPGFYTQSQPVGNRNSLAFIMIPADKIGYSDEMDIPLSGLENINQKQTNLFTTQKKELSLGQTKLTKMLSLTPGLQLIQKSGMTGEGDFFNLQGINTIIGNATPLIVINGIPTMPDMSESGIIGGLSKDVFGSINLHDIKSVTVLKGADASVYGTLGSNGVILIETDKATDLDTKVELISNFGLNYNQHTMPVLSVKDYKSYIGNIALTKYEDMANALQQFPYLVDDPDYLYRYLYDHDTDWQSLIYRPGFTTDNLLKIKGGDAIAKYDVSIGYNNTNNHLLGTNYNKYYTRLNSDVNMSRNLSFTSTIIMSSINSDVQEQGILDNTNPILAAMKKAPIFSPFEQDNVTYAKVRDAEGKLIENNMISNPLAIVNEMMANYHGYDVQINLGLNYKVNNNLSMKALGGLLYNYDYERVFVPGVSQQAFMPLFNEVARNTVRGANRHTTNYFWSLIANYNKVFQDIHALKINGTIQSTINSTEYDAGTGYNTANDFYNTLNNVSSASRNYFGYTDKYNWLNMHVNGKYVYNNILAAGIGLTADASSPTGKDAALFQFYPAINAAWYTKNHLLYDVYWLNKLNVRAEFSSTGNSRYSTSLSKYNYINKAFRELSGIVRSGIPNTKIIPERKNMINAGLDMSAFNHRIGLTADIYHAVSSNLILPVSISSAFGRNYMYENIGTATNSGIEIGINALAVETKTLKWYVGATFSTNKNKLTSLGKDTEIRFDMADGSALISRVGNPIYSFYGYETTGVFATENEAQTAHQGTAPLTLINGKAFHAGDIKFVDQNGDGIIDDKDRVLLGSALPDFFGTAYTNLQFRNLTLAATFNYSVGNKMYNAVRRSMESMSDFSNQLVSTNRRWTYDGQVTNIPQATYGDPMGNARFSDRWIEDASYLKLKELILSYNFKFMAGTTVYVSGENLFTLTNYLGLDPETMYSYDASMRGFDYGKLSLPKTFKIGFKVQF